MSNEGSLRGKVAVVTGAGRGIGQAIAIAYAQAGAAVCCGARSLSQLEDTARRIRTEGGTALAIFCDVTDIASMKELFERTSEQLGGIDIVVACAGAAPRTNDWKRQTLRSGERRSIAT